MPCNLATANVSQFLHLRVLIHCDVPNPTVRSLWDEIPSKSPCVKITVQLLIICMFELQKTHIHVMGQTNPPHWCCRKMGRKPHHGLPVPPHSQEEKPEAGLDDTQGLGEEVPFLTYRCFIETLQQCIILMARIIFWQVTKWDTTNSSLMSSLGLSCSQVRARIRSTRPCSSAVLGKGQR